MHLDGYKHTHMDTYIYDTHRLTDSHRYTQIQTHASAHTHIHI